MIRFVLERQCWNGPNQPIIKSYVTIDGDLYELENKLKSGGFGNNHGLLYNLVGAEVIDTKKQESSCVKDLPF